MSYKNLQISDYKNFSRTKFDLEISYQKNLKSHYNQIILLFHYVLLIK